MTEGAPMLLHAGVSSAVEASWCSSAECHWTSTAPAWNPPFISVIGRYLDVSFDFPCMYYNLGKSLEFRKSVIIGSGTTVVVDVHHQPCLVENSFDVASDLCMQYPLSGVSQKRDHCLLLVKSCFLYANLPVCFPTLYTPERTLDAIYHHQPCLIENSFDVASDLCMHYPLKDSGLFLVKPQQNCFAEKPTNMGKKKLLESRCSPCYIHDMMSTLSKNNSVEKLTEIDKIRFRFLRLVPNWSVKQAIMVHLAESYQVKPRTFTLDIGNIRLNAKLIGRVLGIPSRGKFCYLNYLVWRKRIGTNIFGYRYITMH
ncbi:hypothetical protein AHAS_Ahas11G0126000 [Arachis hypogaea]